MVLLTKNLKKRLKKLSMKTNDLFSTKDNLNVLKFNVTTKNPKYNKSNYDKIYSQIPDGVYNTPEQLINTLASIYDSNVSKNITYSPIIRKYKTFDACKKLSYSKGNIITGRDKEIDQILMTLSRRNKRGVIIVGEAGTGKTAIVNEINSKLINGTVPFPLKNCVVHHLDIPWLFTHYKDDPLSKLVEILEQAAADPKHILFIDEVHQLLNEKFNDILKPYLTGTIRFIGATTIDEYHNVITEDKAIERRFTLVNITEPSVDATIKMVSNTKKVFETYHNCSIPLDICEYLVENGSRFLGHRKNPDKSFDILDKSCSIMNIKDVKEVTTFVPDANDEFKGISDDHNYFRTTELTSGERTLSKRHIDLAISDIGGIDYDYIKNSLNYSVIVDKMNGSIVNQDSAIKELANISNIMKHINSVRTRPISIVLLIGSHGVGKSKSVNMLSEMLFGSTNNVIEYDLAQYTQEFQLTELKGAPPGYVGYQKSGKLIKDLRNNPQSIVYLKHINKCHKSISEYLLTSIQNGKMVDSAEREVSLNNAIIIFSVSLEEKDNKLISSKGMGFAADDTTTANLEKVISKNILDAVDTTIRYNKLESSDLDKVYELNVTDILNMYSDIDLDTTDLKQKVMEKECKNGHDVVSRITSIVPKLIFEQAKK